MLALTSQILRFHLYEYKKQEVFFILFLILISTPSGASVIPSGLSDQEAQEIGKNFSHIFSLHTSRHPDTVGSDFELELGLIFQDLIQNKISNLGKGAPEKFISEPTLTLRKGLYWNFDFSITSSLPIVTNFSLAYAIGLSRSSEFNFFKVKPELYIFSYNLDNKMDQNGLGFTLVFFKKVYDIDVGLGLNLESYKVAFQDFSSSRIVSSGKNTFSDTSILGTLRLGYQMKRLYLGLSLNYLNSRKKEAALSLSYLL